MADIRIGSLPSLKGAPSAEVVVREVGKTQRLESDEAARRQEYESQKIGEIH